MGLSMRGLEDRAARATSRGGALMATMLGSMFKGSQGAQRTMGDTVASEHYYYATEIGNVIDDRVVVRCVFVLSVAAALVSIGVHFWNRLRGTSPVRHNCPVLSGSLFLDRRLRRECRIIA